MALSRKNARCYALIDLANVAPEASKIQRTFESSNALCIFGDPSPAAQLASPWLIPLRPPLDTDRLLRHTVALAKRSSAVSWLISELAAPELAQRLRARTEARLPDRYGVLLRHFDPRVLPVLRQALKAAQRDVFFSLGVAWLYLDRTASLSEIAMTSAPVTDCFSVPLELDDEQVAALLDAAEIDAVMPELVKEEPDRFLGLGSGPARHSFTEQALQRARHWKLDQFPQKVVFCVLSLRLGPGFDDAPAWQQALGGVAKLGLSLPDAIEKALNGFNPERGSQHAI